jgi:PAS domain S-box-containing protein
MASLVGTVPWVAVGSLAAGGATLGLVAYLYRHRGKPGANWFMLALAAQALFCCAYGVGLLVPGRTPRLVLEMVAWVGLCWTGYLFLAFALAYTGRTELLESWPFRALAAVPTLTMVLVLAQPTASFVWRDFTVTTVLDVSVAQYAIQPWGYVAVITGMAYAGLGVFLLLETILRYGPLYRREAVAVALSTAPPTVGLVAWLFDVGFAPQLNFAAVLFLPHAALDAYAFVGTNMFESNPATRRAAEREIIEDIPNPMVVLDPLDRIVAANGAARDLFAVSDSDALERSITGALDVDVAFETDGERQYVTVPTDGRDRVFGVLVSSLTDPNGTQVGKTVVFQDVTEEREREQRLEVLNRVMRHNLRNEMNVVGGLASHVEAESDRGDVERWAERIADSSERLTDIGETVRTFERLRDTEPTFESVDVGALVVSLAEEFEADGDVTVETTVADGAAVYADPVFLRLALQSLLETAREHADSGTLAVSVAVGDDGETEIRVTGDETGIPDRELRPVLAGAESALDHGSGVGLWVVRWSLQAIGGELAVDDDGDGTGVAIRFGDRAETAEATAD